MRRTGHILALLVLASLTVLPRAAAGPVLNSATYYGGPGNEGATGIAIRGSDLYVAGSRGSWLGSRWGPWEAILLRYTIPSLELAWHATLLGDTWLKGVAVSSDTVYAAGAAKPPACGASDGVGGTEHKALLAWYSTSGALLGCGSLNFFSYRGCEDYGRGWSPSEWPSENRGGSPVIVVEEGLSRAVYAVGSAQANWSNWTAVLAKYDSTGTLLWWRSVGDTAWSKYSSADALAWLDDYLYVAGYQSGSGYPDGHGRLWKYDPAGNQMWVESLPPAGYPRANDVAAAGEYLYLAGWRADGPYGGDDVLLLKYAEDGSLLWSNEWGGAADDRGYGIAVDGDRVYVVGDTTSFGGGKDAFLLEVDAASGTILSTTYWGGAADDIGADVAVSGSHIYVVGQTASFGAGGDDLVLLRFGTNRPPVAEAGEDYTAEGNTTGGADVPLDGSGSSDPDGNPLTYLWTWSDESGDHEATGVSPTIFLPLGETVVTLVVNDGHVDSEPDTVTLTVEDTTPPAVTDLEADPNTLWPPNHKMRDVMLSYSVSDMVDADPDVEIAVTCNELDFEPDEDAEIIDACHLKLRAERNGRSKDGRIYTVTLTATDDTANQAECQTTVTVPHDMRDKSQSATVTSAFVAPTAAGAQIVFALSADANVTVTVVNIAGRTVRHVARDRNAKAGVNSLVWDARNQHGAKVPAGIYLVHIAANAADGARSSRIVRLRLNR